MWHMKLGNAHAKTASMVTSSVLKIFSASCCASAASMLPKALDTRRCSQKASRRISCNTDRHMGMPTTAGRHEQATFAVYVHLLYMSRS